MLPEVIYTVIHKFEDEVVAYYTNLGDAQAFVSDKPWLTIDTEF